jgi:hypothetical protein
MTAMFVNGSKRNARSINKHGCHRQILFLIGRFLKIFFSETAWPNGPKPFGQAVSEKIFLEINQSETRIACGGHVC